jgi:hypothetical protein
LPTVTFLITAAANTRSPFAGKWEAALGGGLNWTVEIEVDGAAARGRVGGLAPMKDGRIEGSTLSFKVNSTDGTRTITFTGKLQGEHLSFTRTVEVLPGGDPGVPGLLGGSRLRAFTARRIQ